MVVTQNLRSFLAGLDIFKGIPRREVDAVAELAHEKKIARGATIFSEGEPCSNAWLLKDGMIKIDKFLPEGRVLTIEIIYPRELFGAICTMDGGPYPCTALASLDSTIVGIPSREFFALVGRYPSIAQGVFLQGRQRLREAQAWRVMSQQPVEQRIAGVLLHIGERLAWELPLTRQEIADLAGTTVETAIRTLTEFEKKGLVESSRRHIKIPSHEKLQSYLDSVTF